MVLNVFGMIGFRWTSGRVENPAPSSKPISPFVSPGYFPGRSGAAACPGDERAGSDNAAHRPRRTLSMCGAGEERRGAGLG